MARIESKVTVNNFVGGLVTDYHELNTPTNVTVDEDNCDLDRRGSRKRRLGIDFEDDYSTSSDTWTSATITDMYLGNSVWEAVDNDGNQNFLVVQAGSKLYFYDMGVDPVSSGLLSHTTNLLTYKAYGAVTDAVVTSSGVQTTSGKGALFVCGEFLTPFYITYDSKTKRFTETSLSLRIRDQKLYSATTDYEAQPPSINDKQKYDYFNQGWYYTDIKDFRHYTYTSVLDMFYQLRGKHPPMSKQWFVGKTFYKDDTFETFLADQYDSVYTGNVLAPLGHYIIDPFNIDRSGVSGVGSFPIEQALDRPTAITFYAGKVFYGWKNQVLFSQTIIDDIGVASKCYQQADPTGEDISDLVATDGGVIPLQLSGEIVALQPFENSLIVFSTNGVWAIGGSQIGQGFSANGFSLYKISSVGAVGPRSVISIDGTPCWWTKTGIYMIESTPAKQGFMAVNICKDKIQLYYDAIPGTSKLYATGTYDRLKKIVTWIYNGEDTALDGNVYFCNKALNYDTLLGAFFPYTLSDLTELTPRIADVFALYDVSAESVTEDVTATGGVVTDHLSAAVTVDKTVLGNFDNQNNIGVKFLTFSKEIVSG